MDTIFVENLQIIGKHGVLGHEWSHEQRFLVDIRVETDTTHAGKTDDLAASINYVELCEIAKRIIQGDSVYLIEKLAGNIAEEILKNPLATHVSVTIRKPSVLPNGVPGVTVVRKKSV